MFDPANPEHVRIIDEINYGNGLPVRPLRQYVSWQQHQWPDLINRRPVCAALVQAGHNTHNRLDSTHTSGSHDGCNRPANASSPCLSGYACVLYCRHCVKRAFCGDVQEMRTYKEAEQAGKTVGFELVRSIDIATASPVVQAPWCEVDSPLICNAQCAAAELVHSSDTATAAPGVAPWSKLPSDVLLLENERWASSRCAGLKLPPRCMVWRPWCGRLSSR